MDYKVGDKVRVRSDLEWWKRYSSSDWLICYFSHCMEKYRGKEFTIKSYLNNWCIRLEWTHFEWMDCFFEQSNIKPVSKRPKYEWYAIEQDGTKFERNAIWWRSLEEIKTQIQQNKETINRDESLLRRHKTLFSKKK